MTAPLEVHFPLVQGNFFIYDILRRISYIFYTDTIVFNPSLKESNVQLNLLFFKVRLFITIYNKSFVKIFNDRFSYFFFLT